jgi:hypothetical protein
MDASVIADLLNSGLALVPVSVGRKGPSAKGWNLPENAITKSEEADRLANSNVGLAHAYCEPTPTCAIDIDDFPKAKRWLSTYHVDIKALLLGNEAVVIASGKKNSIKILYRLPYETGALVSKQVKCDTGSMMLEFRCATRNGKTVQDLLPPSRHPSGSTYQWMGKGNPLQIPTIPKCLLVIWLQLIGNGNKKPHTQACNQSLETPRRVARVKEMLSFIDADCDYFTWRGIVWALLSTGWSCATELAREWSETAPHRFNEDDFLVLAESYKQGIDGGLSIGTIYHYARVGGWNE